MDRISEATAALEIENVDGGRVRFGTLWSRGPVVVALVRHFG